jgi:hypothetical protein
MEYTPEHLPPPHRRDAEQSGERVYRFNYSVKQVHPLVGLLIGLAGLALFAVMLVFFFWFAVIALCAGALVFVLRSILGAFRA